jgi:FMN-dependent NADH-azoreductase
MDSVSILCLLLIGSKSHVVVQENPRASVRNRLEAPMSKLLLVTASIFGKDSKSRQIAEAFVDGWRREHPGTVVVERDVGTDPLPHITAEKLGAVMTPADKRTPVQAAAVAHADELIEEVEAADVIVLAAPMYNFTVPSTLKAWIDHIARAGRTFRYTEAGPVGLLTGKKVFVVTARGGVFSEGPAKVLDFHEPYLRGILGFLGLSDVTFVYAEGLNISPESAAAGLDKARAKVASLLARAAA